jgi:hypothetical protein
MRATQIMTIALKTRVTSGAIPMVRIVVVKL